MRLRSGWRRLARPRYIALLGVCVAGAALFAVLHGIRDEPTRASVDDAVRTFREEDGRSGHGGGPGEPALGVYRYATRGSESAHSPIASATHDYGGVSTIVLSPGRCGELERWQVLTGRWTEAEACPGSHGGEFKATEFHEFFGVGREDRFRCRAGSTAGSSVVRVGARFSSSCRSDGSSISSDSRVVGFEKVPVAGKALDAVHLVSRSLLEGETSGTARREEWRRRSDGLLLRRTVDSDATMGAIHYTEHYTIRLLEPKPLR
jgi:hypothetical protein